MTFPLFGCTETRIQQKELFLLICEVIEYVQKFPFFNLLLQGETFEALV